MVDIKTIQEGLREIDIAAHNSWHLGKNMVVGWTTHESGIQLCISPCFRVLEQASSTPRLLNGRRLMDPETFAECCKTLQARPIRVSLPFTVRTEQADGEVDPETVDTVIRRYSIVRTEHRAIMMLEIMGFSAASPVEQIARLNSLEYSINNSGKKLRDSGLSVELARSTAGDGFHYVWNRLSGLEADLRTYAALLLILADNALARRHAGEDSRAVPLLRASFAIGSHYSYHQVEGTKPRSIEYATGEVTITLARLIVKALQGQIVVGNFRRPDEASGMMLDSLLFLVKAETALQRLAGTVLGDHAIKEMRSIVTSGMVNGKPQPVVKYVIEDKHGFRHEAFNLRAKVKRADAEPIELGLRPEQLVNFPAVPAAYVLPVA